MSLEHHTHNIYVLYIEAVDDVVKTRSIYAQVLGEADDD